MRPTFAVFEWIFYVKKEFWHFLCIFLQKGNKKRRLSIVIPRENVKLLPSDVENQLKMVRLEPLLFARANDRFHLGLYYLLVIGPVSLA